MRSFTFNGVNCTAYGIAISGEGSYDAPQRDSTTLAIPGRNGDLILDNGRWKNITLKYPAFVVGNFPTNVAAITEWLMYPLGYARLEDDYHTDEYRMAIFSGGLSYEPTAWNQHAKFDIKFNCKPQRFLKSGETSVNLADGANNNPRNIL